MNVWGFVRSMKVSSNLMPCLACVSAASLALAENAGSASMRSATLCNLQQVYYNKRLLCPVMRAQRRSNGYLRLWDLFPALSLLRHRDRAGLCYFYSARPPQSIPRILRCVVCVGVGFLLRARFLLGYPLGRLESFFPSIQALMKMHFFFFHFYNEKHKEKR